MHVILHDFLGILKVDESYLSLIVNAEIIRFDIAVNVASLMQFLERLNHLPCYCQYFAECDLPSVKVLKNVLPNAFLYGQSIVLIFSQVKDLWGETLFDYPYFFFK